MSTDDEGGTVRTGTMIEIAGRRFPRVTVICPPDERDFDDEDDYSRSLGSGGNDQSVYIPAENGLLFEVEQMDNGTWSLCLLARACAQYDDPDGPMWLPRPVDLFDGGLRVAERPGWGVSGWRNAYPDWVAETIDRLSRKPFTQPAGPEVQLVSADYFAERADA